MCVDTLNLEMDNTVDNIVELKICSYNCRSLKSAMYDVLQLCETHDVVCLQEHWLLPNELSMLSDIHSDFYGFGYSAVDISSTILIGRPYGGTAILYRKHLAPYITFVEYLDSRLTAVIFSSAIGPILVCSVYMPTDYNDECSLIMYQDVCAKIQACFDDSDCVQVLIIGDLNCHSESRFFPFLSQLVFGNNWMLSDVNRLSDVYTYFSDSGLTVSWLDHVICSSGIDSRVSDIAVLYGYMGSDHRPLSVTVAGVLCHNIAATDDDSTGIDYSAPDWSKVDDVVASEFSAVLDDLLQNVYPPYEAITCCTGQSAKCSDCSHRYDIDQYYTNVASCIKQSVDIAVPKKASKCNQYNVPGWCDIVQDKYDASRAAFLDWVHCGRPRTGAVFEHMSRCRARFKLAFRFCRQHEDQLKADACAKSLNLGDGSKFWRSVKRMSNGKATKHASCVADVTGDDNIAEMWKNHFAGLYNSVTDNDFKTKFYERVTTTNYNGCLYITPQDVATSCRQQKKGKCAGPDGLHMEAFVFGCSRLYVHLSVLFNLFLSHCHLPNEFMQSVVVPLVKSKTGNMNDANNYRAIALSNAVSKILESIFLQHVKSNSDVDMYQFGFKAGHSTGQCTNLLKNVVKYYADSGSHVFVCFLDFSKAFDKVNYWHLFNKLLDDNVAVDLVSILAYWYSHQQMYVRWKMVTSDPFLIGNGTKQGGVLSPYLFSRYVRELIAGINTSGSGCNIGGKFYNILAYADDMVLLAPSWFGLQRLIDILSALAGDISMSCNVMKTVCMIFNPTCKHKAVSCIFPEFTLNGAHLKYVCEFKYLGHVLNNKLSDDDDIKRETRNMFVRTNILLRRFGKCSVSVKLSLFRSYCLCFYDIGMWSKYSSTVFKRMEACYNKCVKSFFKYRRLDSVTDMLCELGLTTFSDLFQDNVVKFKIRWLTASNDAIRHFTSAFVGRM